MSYGNEKIARRLRESREVKGLSQRDLSRISGVPQAQISRIESGQVDLRYSSLLSLAHSLGLEVTLVPRRMLPAVKALLSMREGNDESDGSPRPAYTLDEDVDA